jgi:hypothetical protein
MKKIFTIAALTLLTFGGCNKNNEKDESETPPNAASTQTWKFGDQTWSDAIRIPACNKSDFMDSFTSPDCRSYTYGSTTWHYYNWPYVIANQDKMCPAPWRVPTNDDFMRLEENSKREYIIAAWGLPGYAYGHTLSSVGGHGYLWSSTEDYNNMKSFILDYSHEDYRSSIVSDKSHGMQVRCVR